MTTLASEEPNEDKKSSIAKRKAKKRAITSRSKNEDIRETDGQRLLTWREERFKEIGYNSKDSFALADSDVDWHELLKLIEKGCSLTDAKNILL